MHIRLPFRRDGDRPWYALLDSLAASSSLLPLAIAHRYDADASRRASAGLAAALLVQERFVARCLAHYEPNAAYRSPDLADALTLSRAVAAAWLAALCASGVRDRAGTAGWLGWGALMWGETVSDWLDGPLARRRGGTRMGSALDLEADSWLTLWAALAAVRWGDLPPWYVAAPVLRYLLPFAGRRPANGTAAKSFPGWDRTVGVAQMAVITMALCPCAPGSMRAQARRVATPIAIASLSCLIARELAQRQAPGRLAAGIGGSILDSAIEAGDTMFISRSVLTLRQPPDAGP